MQRLAPRYFGGSVSRLLEAIDREHRQDEFGLLVETNELLLELDAEIQAIFKLLRDSYCRRFPELESVNLSPAQYAHAVQAIGRAEDITKVDLSAVLPPPVLLVVNMSATTTNGRPLSSPEFHAVEQAASALLGMHRDRSKMMDFVQRMMAKVAPNVTAIVGSKVASQLVGAAGGLRQLAAIPAGNIQVIGAARRELAGMSTASAQLHAGFVFGSDLVQDSPPEHQTRAQRLVAAKVGLAARIDALGADPGGQNGAAFRAAIVSRLERLAEPAPLKQVRPIPPPPLESKTRRGGKRARKQKELVAMTKVRKLQNRVAFGQAEQERIVGSSVVGMGMLAGPQGGGSAASSVLRLPPIDNKAREAIKRHSKKLASGFFSSGLATAKPSPAAPSNGMATSLTLSTGIGLSNPSAAKGLGPSRYFDASAPFRKKP